jgi:hypothetical protein
MCCFRNCVCDKIKHMVAQTAFQIHDSPDYVQDVVDSHTETASSALDNSQFRGK